MDYRKNLWGDRISEMLRKTEVNLLRLSNPYCEETWKYLNTHKLSEPIQSPKSLHHQKQFIREEPEEYISQAKEELDKCFQDLEKIISLKFRNNREEIQSLSDRTGSFEIWFQQTEKTVEMISKQIKDIDNRFKISFEGLSREVSEKVEVNELERLVEEIRKSNNEKFRSIKTEIDEFKLKENTRKEEYIQEFDILFLDFQKKFISKVEYTRLKESFNHIEESDNHLENQTDQKLLKLKKNVENMSNFINESLNDQDSKFSQFSDHFNKKLIEINLNLTKFKEIEAENTKEIKEEIEKIMSMADTTRLERRLSTAEKTLKKIPESQKFDSSIFVEREEIIFLQNRFEEVLREKKILMKKIEYLEEKVENVEEIKVKTKKQKLKIGRTEGVEIVSIGKKNDEQFKKKKRKFSMETQFITIPRAKKPKLSMKSYSILVSKPKKHRLSLETSSMLIKRQRKPKLSSNITWTTFIHPIKPKLSTYKESLLVSKPKVHPPDSGIQFFASPLEINKNFNENGLKNPSFNPNFQNDKLKNQDPGFVDFGKFPIQDIPKIQNSENKENPVFVLKFDKEKPKLIEHLDEKVKTGKTENENFLDIGVQNVEIELKGEDLDGSLIELDPIKAKGIPRPKKYQQNMNKNKEVDKGDEKTPEESQSDDSIMELDPIKAKGIPRPKKYQKNMNENKEFDKNDKKTPEESQSDDSIMELDPIKAKGIPRPKKYQKIENKKKKHSDDFLENEENLFHLKNADEIENFYNLIIKNEIKYCCEIAEQIKLFHSEHPDHQRVPKNLISPTNPPHNQEAPQSRQDQKKNPLQKKFSSDESSENKPIEKLNKPSYNPHPQPFKQTSNETPFKNSIKSQIETKKNQLYDDSSSKSSSDSKSIEKKYPVFQPESFDTFAIPSSQFPLKTQEIGKSGENKILELSSSGLPNSQNKNLDLQKESLDIFARLPENSLISKNLLGGGIKEKETDKRKGVDKDSSSSDTFHPSPPSHGPVNEIESIDIFAKVIEKNQENVGKDNKKNTEYEKIRLGDDHSSAFNPHSQDLFSDLLTFDFKPHEFPSRVSQTNLENKNLLTGKQIETDIKTANPKSSPKFQLKLQNLGNIKQDLQGNKDENFILNNKTPLLSESSSASQDYKIIANYKDTPSSDLNSESEHFKNRKFSGNKLSDDSQSEIEDFKPNEKKSKTNKKILIYSSSESEDFKIVPKKIKKDKNISSDSNSENHDFKKISKNPTTEKKKSSSSSLESPDFNIITKKTIIEKKILIGPNLESEDFKVIDKNPTKEKEFLTSYSSESRDLNIIQKENQILNDSGSESEDFKIVSKKNKKNNSILSDSSSENRNFKLISKNPTIEKKISSDSSSVSQDFKIISKKITANKKLSNDSSSESEDLEKIPKNHQNLNESSSESQDFKPVPKKITKDNNIISIASSSESQDFKRIPKNLTKEKKFSSDSSSESQDFKIITENPIKEKKFSSDSSSENQDFKIIPKKPTTEKKKSSETSSKSKDFKKIPKNNLILDDSSSESEDFKLFAKKITKDNNVSSDSNSKSHEFKVTAKKTGVEKKISSDSSSESQDFKLIPKKTSKNKKISSNSSSELSNSNLSSNPPKNPQKSNSIISKTASNLPTPPNHSQNQRPPFDLTDSSNTSKSPSSKNDSPIERSNNRNLYSPFSSSSNSESQNSESSSNHFSSNESEEENSSMLSSGLYNK